MGENHRLEEAIKAGVAIPKDGYWGNVPSKICGPYAGAVDEHMIKEAEKSIKNNTVKRE